MVYDCLRSLLFKLPPELAHDIALESISAGERLKVISSFTAEKEFSPVEVMGLNFPNPVGLAAGLDKNGDYFNGLGQLGFGFIEIGTITPQSQPGNPSPRMFRIPQQQALINRLGFNNKGVEHLVNQVKKRRYNGILGINISKNATTDIDNAEQDYRYCFEAVYPHADYVTVNISSPNTTGLRELQTGERLTSLLSCLSEARKQFTERNQRCVPIAIKIAPDNSEDQLKDCLDRIIEYRMDAVIATNTTISRDGVEYYSTSEEIGGLSGKPLAEKSLQCINQIKQHIGDTLPIIGVGGITSATDAVDKINAGASLVQCYTGFIYKGPSLISESVKAIRNISSS